MTVKELIEKLQSIPQNTEVKIVKTYLDIDEYRTYDIREELYENDIRVIDWKLILWNAV